MFARKTWAWWAAIAAHAFAVAGVLLGITALALGLGPSTVANTIYHRVILAVLVVVLALLPTPRAKDPLGRSHPGLQKNSQLESRRLEGQHKGAPNNQRPQNNKI